MKCSWMKVRYYSGTPLLNQVYCLVFVLVGTVNDMPSLIAKQTGSRKWELILISPLRKMAVIVFFLFFLFYSYMFTLFGPQSHLMPHSGV